MAPAESLAQPKVAKRGMDSSDSYETIRWMNIQLNPTVTNNQLFLILFVA